MKRRNTRMKKLGRRTFLRAAAAGAAAAIAPTLWVPNRAVAQSRTGAAGTVKHLIYIRLSGGFRFPTAFNADVAREFNPFGSASGVPDRVQWGVGSLLERAGFLDGEEGSARRDAGMVPVSRMADQISVMPAVDHEPLAGSADGNHTTGLERWYTGYVNGQAGVFTRIMRGLSDRYTSATEEGEVLLPAFVLGGQGMARGVGEWAPHRPPVVTGGSFDRFAAPSGGVPAWAAPMVEATDERMRDRQHPALRAHVDAYVRTRASTAGFSKIFASDLLKVNQDSDEEVDGISNRRLHLLFGDSRASTDIRVALRLFHHGCPAVYLDQGGYDMHSGENDNLPGQFDQLNQLLSALPVALKAMSHPAGGTYWDHTLVVLGSEFSRTARGSRFNSAGGSDHSGDNATRYMSMPFMGGAVGGGRVVGATTRSSDLRANGTVYSYRSVMNSLMDALGCDPSVFFPADDAISELFT